MRARNAVLTTTLSPTRLQHKNEEAWAELGGTEGVAAALHTSLTDGLDPAAADGTDLEARRCAAQSHADGATTARLMWRCFVQGTECDDLRSRL